MNSLLGTYFEHAECPATSARGHQVVTIRRIKDPEDAAVRRTQNFENLVADGFSLRHMEVRSAIQEWKLRDDICPVKYPRISIVSSLTNFC